MPDGIAIGAQLLQIDQIRTDGGTQIRVEFNETASDEFAELLMDGVEFPPVVVFFDGADYWLADGFHRLRAHQRAWREEIAAEVRQGSRRAAILYAVGANAVHGIRRSNRDKRNAVDTMLKDPLVCLNDDGSPWSNYDIAEKCAVSEFLVRTRRQELSTIKSQIAERSVTRGSTTYTMNTANIGAKPAAPAEPAAEPVQTDIEDFTGRPDPVPRFPPAHAAPAERIRWQIEQLYEARKALTPEQVAATVSVKVGVYRQLVGVTTNWLEELFEYLEAMEQEEYDRD